MSYAYRFLVNGIIDDDHAERIAQAIDATDFVAGADVSCADYEQLNEEA